MSCFQKSDAKVQLYLKKQVFLQKKILKKYIMRIIGIGNALMDVLVPLKSYELIDKLELPHGGMLMIDRERFDVISHTIKDLEKEYAAGGSAANTIYGLSKLGVETSFIGIVGKDEVGDIYENDMINSGVNCLLKRSESTPTGCATALVTPDSERTFASFLGAAQELTPKNISEELFTGHDILHIEGYLLFNYAIVETAMKMAKKLGMLVSLDLAAHNFVEENRPIISDLLKNYVDICFANEEEAKALTGLSPHQALDKIADMCDYAVVKIGSKGSLIKHDGIVDEVAPIKVDTVVDTTGAGDLFASGFIYGITKKFSAEKCGQLGSILGGTVIQNYGARIPNNLWKEIYKSI